jgi:hypothetical protein
MRLFQGAEYTRFWNPSNASLTSVMYRSRDLSWADEWRCGGLRENEPMRANSLLTRPLARPNTQILADVQETSIANSFVCRGQSLPNDECNKEPSLAAAFPSRHLLKQTVATTGSAAPQPSLGSEFPRGEWVASIRGSITHPTVSE